MDKATAELFATVARRIGLVNPRTCIRWFEGADEEGPAVWGVYSNQGRFDPITNPIT